MTLKCKQFYNDGIRGFNEEINEWLEDNQNIEVVNMTSLTEASDWDNHVVLILYKEN